MEPTFPSIQYKQWFYEQFVDIGEVVWTDTGVDLIVKDVDNNEDVKFQQLKDFFAQIDVPALKEGNLLTMFQAGLTKPEDIINMTEGELCSLIGKAIGKKIFTGLREKFTNIPVYLLMGSHPSFGRGVGVRKMKKLFEAFQGDMSKCQSVVAIIQVDGFDHKTASKIAAGYPKFVQFLQAVDKFVTLAAYQAPKTGKLTGAQIVFTGFRSAELEKEIENQGGKIGSGVSNKTTFVVADSVNSSSGKAEKARTLGVEIITVEMLKERLYG